MPNIETWMGESNPLQYAAMADNANAMNRYPYTATVSGERYPNPFGVVYSVMPFRLDLTSPRANVAMGELSDVPTTPVGYFPQGYRLEKHDQIAFNNEVYEVIDVLIDQTPLADCRVNLTQVNQP